MRAWPSPTALPRGPVLPAVRIIVGRARPRPRATGRFAGTSIEVCAVPRTAILGLVILSVGDLVLDVRIAPEGPLQTDDDTPAAITLGGGGQAANFCAWTAALGEPVRLIARVGDD